MQLNRIKAIRGDNVPRRIAGRPSLVAPNHVQRCTANQVWVKDITYIRTWQGWLYKALVIDLFARNVVGWLIKPTLSREMALDVLMMAVCDINRTARSSRTQTRAASMAATTGNSSVGPIIWHPV